MSHHAQRCQTCSAKRRGEQKRSNYRGYYVTTGGYRMLRQPDHPNAQKSGWVFEHVAVMSEKLGRPLLPHENVHHKNGDKLDNRLSNLELWSTSQPPGQRVKDKVEWAREILALYAEQEWV
jgi:hypothetical protein